MNEQMSLPQAVQDFISSKGFVVESQLPNERYIILKGHLADSDQKLILKLESGNPRNSMNQRNLVVWTKSVQDALPADAPYGIAPILEDGFIDQKWHWFLCPFIEGEPFAVVDKDVTRVMVRDPEELLPQIVALIRQIEKVSATSVADLDVRAGFGSKPSKASLLDMSIQKKP